MPRRRFITREDVEDFLESLIQLQQSLRQEEDLTLEIIEELIRLGSLTLDYLRPENRVQESILESIVESLRLVALGPEDLSQLLAQWQSFEANTVGEAVEQIIPYLEDTSEANQVIYFDGWSGLAASKVLRVIAEEPPPSLRNKFDNIIHVDCSRWKNRRMLQKEIAQKLDLPQEVMAIFHKQDNDDDFNGVDEGSRDEIGDIGREIHQALQGRRCLVVFHNGSNTMVDLNDFGIPRDQWSNLVSKVLWTFRGRLNPIKGTTEEPNIVQTIDLYKKKLAEEVDNSQIYLYSYFSASKSDWVDMLQEEIGEILRYTHSLDVSTEVATKCCLYLLKLNSKNGNVMDYNWATHASNYWVCDGIIQGGHSDKAWEVASALHQQIRLEDYSSNSRPNFGDRLKTPLDRWVSEVIDTNSQGSTRTNVPTILPEPSSFFLAIKSGPNDAIASFDMFHRSDKLRVLKLCQCTFNFSSPPFHGCRSLRFLGLDGCKDQPQRENEKKKKPEIEFFQSLWVLDICNTDWELASSPKITEQMAANIREVHIKKGRFWHHNFTWRQLQNLRKLRVIEPTCPWETGKMDEFTDMTKLEFLDLSGNCTIKVMPSLSGATSLKTLVLVGCVELEYIGPEGLPPSLELFSLDASTRGDHKKEAKITCISLAGCARLVNFILRGSLPNLEELDLSGTLVKMLELNDKVMQAPRLQRLILLGCLQLRAILWPKEGLPKLIVLCIDSLVCRVRTELDKAYATIMDMRFFQHLVLKNNREFCWKSNRFHLNLCVSSTTKVKGQSYMKENIGPGSTGKKIGPPRQKSLIPRTYLTYSTDVHIDNIATNQEDKSGHQFQQLGCHVEIGEGINDINVESRQGIEAIIFVMSRAESFHVHDNSSITTVIPERITGQVQLGWRSLKQCRVERCPKLNTVFTINYNIECFEELEEFLAVDLLMAHCIWSIGKMVTFDGDSDSFAKLRSIHLYYCPRLIFVLPLSGLYTLSNLEILHIVCCGDLRQVFPDDRFLTRIAGVLEFPNLKHIHLHELFRLQQICEAKVVAPKLETVRVRGCWGLRRLPAVPREGQGQGMLAPKLETDMVRGCWGLRRLPAVPQEDQGQGMLGSEGRQEGRPVVDCEKDWWEKLEWDGLEAGHHPSLFEPRHSLYHKMPLPRVSVLR